MNSKELLPHSSMSKNRAFTIVEMMFVLVTIGIVSIGLTTFMKDSARSMLWSVNKPKITNDFRLFTLQISNDAINADYMFIYTSFEPQNYDEPESRIQAPYSGDFLVFADTKAFPDVTSPRFYKSITAYYREPDTNLNSPVLRSRIEFPEGSVPAGPETVNINFEDFLKAQQPIIINNAEPVLELVNGLTDDRLFRLINNGQAFLINGEIIHGENAQRVTNTYNLTISNRSLL